jgi:hypothetical protein
MPRNRDTVENAIVNGIWAIGGGLMDLVIAASLGSRRRQQMKESRFKLPDGLAIDYDHPRYVAPEDRPWFVKQYKLCFLIPYLAAVGFGCAGLYNMTSLGTRSQAPLFIAVAIPVVAT